jgi:HJR/Mrr/RecB family endonuclease
MPEELAIILAILIGAIWLLVKIVKGIAAFMDQATKNHHAAEARRRQDEYSRGRDSLGHYIRTLIPNELDLFEKKFERVRIELDQARVATGWVAHPPGWKREKFQVIVPPRKDKSYGAMCVDEIDAILTPNSDDSTWSFEESKIISRECKYPSAPPVSNPEKFTLFPTLNADLKHAVFEIDASHISKKDAHRYFAIEQANAQSYNSRRADLVSKTIGLNTRIEEWNRTNRISWEAYVSESERLGNEALLEYRGAAELYTKACREEVSYFKRLREGYTKGKKQCAVERLGFVVDRIRLPGSVPHTWDIDFEEEQQIAVIDVGLPDVVHRPPYKTKSAILKLGGAPKPLNQLERKELIPKVHPAILLRTAQEIFRSDTCKIIKLLVVNGWVEFDDPATGLNTKAYTASLMVEREQITALNLTRVDPTVAFNNLHGKSAGKLVEIIPIEPVLSLNRHDSRFVNAKEILKGLGTETNLAAMDWQDFEHLIRELFEKEFSGRGAEVKVTQTSRDRGVDAIVFDPDPIRGGKFVIQAKRYTNTVDVSAVRDLCAVVQKEGASRGILVTTSTYGADAYAFANNEPVTLLNGAELLGLLKKHGYAFRIDLQEARRSF